MAWTPNIWFVMWLIWLGVAVVAVTAEVISLQFVLLMVGIGALGASAAAGLGATSTVQVVVFAVLTVTSLIVGRPRLLAWSRRTPPATTNISSLIGLEAVTLTEVGAGGGRVRIRGDEWSARSAQDEDTFPPGAHVTVQAIDGVTAVVALTKGKS